MKETIQTAAESFLPALWTMSRAMYDHPELGLEEVNSSRMLREWLAEQGFKVEENFHGLPTAFRAVYGSGRPVLGFLCEYDALPEVGHGCGHDLIGVVSAGAAAALRQTVDAVGGTLIVYGTPDEEVTCTKVQLTDEGAFDELDVALMLHPYQKTCGRMGSIGIYPVQYEFFGKKCHANEAGYAANPQYAQQLIKIIEDYQLFLLDEGQDVRIAENAAPVEEPVAEPIPSASPADMVDVDNYSVSIQGRNGGHTVYRNNGSLFIVVRDGDKLESVASEFRVSPKKLIKYNDLDIHSNVKTGDMIYIRPKAKRSSNGKMIHVARDGETLHSISQMYGIRLKSLCNINRRSRDSQVTEGQQIRLM